MRKKDLERLAGTGAYALVVVGAFASLGAGCPTKKDPTPPATSTSGGSTSGDNSSAGGTGGTSAGSTGDPGDQCAKTFPLTGNLADFRNVYNRAVLHSGFVRGALGDSTSKVLVSFDDDTATEATHPTLNGWMMPVPHTWRRDSLHSISLQPIDSQGTPGDITHITVVRGTNLDINGDGFADIVVGSRGGGLAGKVSVFLTNAYCGISATTAVPGDGGPTVEITASVQGGFGATVAVDDINGDGYGDVIVGGTQGSLGKVWGFLAKGTDEGVTVAATSNDADFAMADPTASTGFGNALTTGDVNGDGYADVIVGAVTAHTSDIAKQGKVYVFQSTGSGGITATTPVAGPSGPDSTIACDDTSFQFGQALVAADFNGDGYSDIAASSNDTSATYDVKIFLASNTGSGIAATLSSQRDSVLAGDDGSNFGLRLSVGDVNRDGYQDLGTVEPYGAPDNVGQLFIFHGDATGMPSKTAAQADTKILGDASGNLSGDFAFSDLNADGYADLAASNYAAVVTYLSSGAAGITATSTVLGSGGPAQRIAATTEADYFGASIAFANQAGSAYPDLIVGAPEIASKTGMLYVFPCNTGGVHVDGTGPLGATLTITGRGQGNEFGWAQP